MSNEKSRRGRPRSSSGSTKSESLLVRLTPAEKQAFADAASLAGIALSAWMRERLRQIAIRELASAGKRAAFLDYQGQG